MKFISSKEFSNTCDLVVHHAYTDNVVVPQETPKRIFTTGEYEVFSRFLPVMKSFKDKYELIYHRSDKAFDRFALESIKPHVSHIWAQNCEFSHPMITKLPLGFNDDKVPERLNLPKDILCYLNVGLANDRELKFVMCRSIRNDCLNHFKNKVWCTVEQNVPFETFIEKLNRAKFVICPVGFGVDTYRFYEAAWLGCTPIVMSSGLDDLHKKFGALIVNSWDEVTEELLRNHTPVKVPDDLFDINTYLRDV